MVQIRPIFPMLPIPVKVKNKNLGITPQNPLNTSCRVWSVYRSLPEKPLGSRFAAVHSSCLFQDSGGAFHST